jgi:hypothetical protein
MHASSFNVVAIEYRLTVPSIIRSSWNDPCSRQSQH